MELPGFGPMVLAIAALFGALALSSVYDLVRFLRRAARAQAKVVGYDREEDNDYSNSHFVRVSFEDTQGVKRVVSVKNVAIASGEYERGASIVVLFDPSNPDDTRVCSFAGIWSPLVMLSIATVIFLAIGLCASLIR